MQAEGVDACWAWWTPHAQKKLPHSQNQSCACWCWRHIHRKRLISWVSFLEFTLNKNNHTLRATDTWWGGWVRSWESQCTVYDLDQLNNNQRFAPGTRKNTSTLECAQLSCSCVRVCVCVCVCVSCRCQKTSRNHKHSVVKLKFSVHPQKQPVAKIVDVGCLLSARFVPGGIQRDWFASPVLDVPVENTAEPPFWALRPRPAVGHSRSRATSLKCKYWNT